jgi:hypothetical protein
MKCQHTTLLHFVTAFVLLVLLHGCFNLPSDSGGDQYYPPQTKILNVKVQPDTVAPGDTASFTCIIEDSLDKRFKFFWYVDVGKVLDAELFDDEPIVYETEINKVQWVAPQESGFYGFTVLTNNGSEDSISVDKSFVIIVE